MPLLKKRAFTLLEPPKDLDPKDLVYQVRFTKEIFLNYQEYLNRINLYRQRIWTCKTTGKTNLTYEEALVSEKCAAEKIQEIPKEIEEPALRMIQFSMLSLKDLADTIAVKFQERLFVGAELYGRKSSNLCLCKILKIVVDDSTNLQYEVAWLDKNKKITETAVLNRDDLSWKKIPFSRSILRSFIRESTYRSSPWVIHDKLAKEYGISIDPPQDLKDKVIIRDGLVVCNKRRKNADDSKKSQDLEGFVKRKTKKVENGNAEVNEEKTIERENGHLQVEPIRYPIDDLLVKPTADDPVFTARPSPSRDFKVQLECVGDLLMVWDFCCSFGRLLHLWPFSLEDFESAICHKDTNLTLIVETHSALLRLLIKDEGEYFIFVRNKNRKLKITVINWTEYLCDFIESIKVPDLSGHISTIKRGHYGQLDIQTKLSILQELVNQVIETDIVREKLDEYIEQRQMLGATRRGEALEEGRKKKEEKEKLKIGSLAGGMVNGHSKDTEGNNVDVLANGNGSSQNGVVAKETEGGAIIAQQHHPLDESEKKHLESTSVKAGKKQNMDAEVLAENLKDSSKKDRKKPLKDAKTDVPVRPGKDQRKEYYEREMEKRVLRTNPLGKDKCYSRYWWFRRDGRIFVESLDSKLWGYYSSKEELDALMGSLNIKGERERALKKQLEKFYSRICVELQKRSKEAAQRIALEEAVLRRSTRVRALPRENPANAFLRYVNKWKED
ncbi:hypothetical protein K2173_000966 [Erythroxylum novogranatense]|uniref:DDT domain-containing protein n=1 Tax=Erythroxylum novogranatense TaxID=1862640 RepID=A0AAV8TQJ5_9ROSI|nr:hypothetical protein K2173_000966 [Erythroxylum novogranatense]